MRICSSSGVAAGQKICIINVNVISFYPQTVETKKFRLHIVYLFSKHFPHYILFWAWWLGPSCRYMEPRPNHTVLVLCLQISQEKSGYSGYQENPWEKESYNRHVMEEVGTQSLSPCFAQRVRVYGKHGFSLSASCVHCWNQTCGVWLKNSGGFLQEAFRRVFPPLEYHSLIHLPYIHMLSSQPLVP